MRIADRSVGPDDPTYFIADIAASHDGELSRAVDLIHLAAQAGADAAKFQNFTAPKIVSRRGFDELGGVSHQSKWSKSVFDVYADASIPHEWTPALRAACDEAGIAYFSAAYDLEAVDMLDPYVPAFKIGSGDITWLESLDHTARKGKPMLLATGAASLGDVVAAVDVIRAVNPELVLMQCNTNYTASADNMRFLSLRVLSSYAALFPDVVLGLSDHTAGHTSVLGAIALGARVIEKHFTDDTTREGPDHAFSMDPASWRAMVDSARDLEAALGDTVKRVEANESETVVIQRRGVRAARDLVAGTVLRREDLVVVRPATPDLIPADRLADAVGAALRRAVGEDEGIRPEDIEHT
ncbi:N-acetylneuraminate synthase family protein [Microbacterium sp. NPDC055910]|uniref:N-acetylneuraminate synthase family protein n=1 Tax=Microbacterium sp. NPDC055910 TaxID=3345659 RepID=UPI0035DE8265